MAKTRIPEENIRQILAEQESGVSVAELIKKHKISSATFYNWKSKYGESKPDNGPRRGRPKGSGKTAAVAAPAAMAASSAPAASGDENSRLKVMLVDLMLEIDQLKRQLARR